MSELLALLVNSGFIIVQLLYVMVGTGSTVVLATIIWVMCREERHAHEDKIQNSLADFVKG